MEQSPKGKVGERVPYVSRKGTRTNKNFGEYSKRKRLHKIMAYLSIDNLYKDQQILMMKECYALEKIHGTSSHLSYTPPEFHAADRDGWVDKPSRLAFFAGGGKHEIFIELFDAESIRLKIDEIAPHKKVHVYGEFYGGKHMGMREVYGDKQRFVAFEVKIGDTWLNVPNAEDICNKLGIEFVHYKRIPTTMEAIDAERDAWSEQAIRNGMGEHHREGIVLRPLEEITLNSGKRVIAKHKRDEYRETNTPRKVISPDRLKVIENAQAIANEWVTYERLNHILTKGTVEVTLENTGKIIALMTDDILREAEGEIVDSSDARKQIGRLTALMFKDYLKDRNDTI